MPPLNTTIILDVNVYWLGLTIAASAVFCSLVGYLVGYLWGRPKYIVVRETTHDLRTMPPESL